MRLSEMAKRRKMGAGGSIGTGIRVSIHRKKLLSHPGEPDKYSEDFFKISIAFQGDVIEKARWKPGKQMIDADIQNDGRWLRFYPTLDGYTLSKSGRQGSITLRYHEGEPFSVNGSTDHVVVRHIPIEKIDFSGERMVAFHNPLFPTDETSPPDEA